MMWRAIPGLLALVLIGSPALAEAVKVSVRPVARGDLTTQVADVTVPEVVSRAATSLDSYLAPNRSARPVTRPSDVAAKAAPTVAAEAAPSNEITGTPAGFRDWVREFRPRALAQGIKPDIFETAFDGVTFDRKVVERDRNQSEFTKTLWDYLDSAASDARVRNGKAALRKHAGLLEKIEAKYGVEKEIVVAIWGLESAYGTFRGTTPVIQAMASLAYDGRRGAFFEEQLVDALKILQQGDTTPDNLRGSWAGAMGHTQFMPGSFQRLAVDHDGDGRRNIWGDDPGDALASTAHYLKTNGWQTGVPWGVEVRLPENFDYMEAKREVERLPSAWARKGVVGLDGKPVQDFAPASVLLPAGHKGAAFLIFGNFEAIESYNTADAYVIGVGHLADRIRGGAPIKGVWPRQDRALTFAERVELQKRLTAAGFDTQGIDARIGPFTIEAVRGFQRSQGLIPDGYASLDVLKRLR